MTELASYSLQENVATITLDDGKVNALSFEMIARLNELTDRAVNEAKLLVLKGRPGVFSAGFDLKVMRNGTPEDVADLVGKGGELLVKLLLLPIPLVAVGTGHALAAGALTLLTADYRVAVDGDFNIGLNETAIGMPLPTLGVELARERLSLKEMTLATLGAKLYNPQDAAECGYVDMAVSADVVHETVAQIVEGLLLVDTKAFAETKKRLRKDIVTRIQSASRQELLDMAKG